VLTGGEVTNHGYRARKARKTIVRTTIPPSRLDAMIEEAIVDAYNEAEQAVGFHATIEQHLAVPFEFLEFRVPDPPPTGWEWIEAYRQWSGGRW
jgi:hypothetical protein